MKSQGIRTGTAAAAALAVLLFTLAACDGVTTGGGSKATGPDPSHGEINVSVNKSLSWTAGTGATKHLVYFGTDSTPDDGEYKGEQSGTSYDPPGNLSANTTYYWRIDERTRNGTTQGDVWSFTTRAAASPDAPDLVVTNARVDSDDETVETEETFRVYVTVRNQGSAAAGSTRTRYYQSSDATITTSDTEVADESTSDLDPGETDDESEIVTAPSSAGTYYYGACVDAVSNESDTTNNCSNGVRVQVAAAPPDAPDDAPDLVVTNARVDSDDETVETEEMFRVYVTVRNQGSAAAGSTRTRYYQSSDATITTSDTEVADESTSDLDPDETDDESEIVTAPSSAGTYYYGACVDVVSNESDTTNNCSNGVRVQVAAAPPDAPDDAPDLVVTNARVDSDDETVETEEMFRVYVTVRNQGSAAAGSTRTRYYQSSDATITTSDTEVADESTSDLDPDETDDESEIVTAPSSAGTYYYGACVDAVSNESDTTNNCSNGVRVQVEEAGSPDLIIDSFSAPSSVKVGTVLTLRATVKNAGNGSATATTLRYYLTDKTGTKKVEDWADSVSALDQDESSKESQSFTSTDTTIYYYMVCVDSVPRESDTTNNCSQVEAVTAILGVGNPVIVQNVSCDLNVRNGAGTNYTAIDALCNGATGTIKAGPSSANGYKWFRVSWNTCKSGLSCTGWSVEFFGGDRKIAYNG